MKLHEAIEISKKGTATRIELLKNNLKRTIIGYKDGSGYSLYSQNGIVDYFLSSPCDLIAHNHKEDWQPST